MNGKEIRVVVLEESAYVKAMDTIFSAINGTDFETLQAKMQIVNMLAPISRGTMVEQDANTATLEEDGYVESTVEEAVDEKVTAEPEIVSEEMISDDDE